MSSTIANLYEDDNVTKMKHTLF